MRKTIFTLLCACCFISLIFGLTGCDDTHVHNYIEEIIAPTCTEQGYTTHTCECGDSYVDNYITALGHEFTNYINDDNATCEHDATETATCERNGCNEKHSKEISQTAIGHNYGAPTYTWSNDYSKVTATVTCQNDTTHKITETVNTTATITQEQKCEKVELTKYTATFCNEKFTVQIKENVQTKGTLGHDYEVAYVWVIDNSSVTATATCRHNEEHIITETVETFSTITQQQACEKVELTSYTATFTNTLFATQTKENIQTKNVLGHIYGAPTYIWSSDYFKVTATATCKNDNSHKFTETVNTTAAITQEQKCEQVELTKYTAKFKSKLFTTQIKDNIQTKNRLSHVDGEWIIDKEATCVECGSKRQICSNCKKTIKAEVIPPQHIYEKKVVQKTCINEAFITNYCSKCQYSYNEEIAPIELIVERIGTSRNPNGPNSYGWSYLADYRITIIGGHGDITCSISTFYNRISASALMFTRRETRQFDISLDFNGEEAMLEQCYFKFKIKDAAENEITYEIACIDCSTTSTITSVGECKKLISEHDISYLNIYGFDKYTCDDCKKELYKDKNSRALELAELVLSADGKTIMKCTNINSADLLIIPESVTSLADQNMFYRSSLNYVLFPSNGIRISLWSSAIQHIFIPSNVRVDLDACRSLHTIVWGEGVTFLDALSNPIHSSTVQRIVIPVSLREVEYNFFDGIKTLKNVYYLGTEEQWNKIIINLGNAYLTEAKRYYYSETKPTESGNYWHYVDGEPTIW